MNPSRWFELGYKVLFLLAQFSATPSIHFLELVFLWITSSAGIFVPDSIMVSQYVVTTETKEMLAKYAMSGMNIN